MRTHLAVALSLLLFAVSAAEAAGKRTQFWNLTANTINELHLSPAGQNTYGPDQCKNDDDGTVDADERLRVTGVVTGMYDVKFTDVRKRSCEAKNVAVKEGTVFSVSEKDITCQK